MEEPPNPAGDIVQLISVKVGTEQLNIADQTIINSLDQPIVLRFTKALNISNIGNAILLKQEDNQEIPITIAFLDNNKTASAKPDISLIPDQIYELTILNTLSGSANEKFDGATYIFKTEAEPLLISNIEINGQDLTQTGKITDIGRFLNLNIEFSHPVDLNVIKNNLTISNVPLSSFSFTDQDGEGKLFQVTSNTPLIHLHPYTIRIKDDLKSIDGNPFAGFQASFYTAIDSTFKFPLLSDEELLSKIQEYTFKYFWDFGHPVSGLSRERNSSDNTVTSGGSGFGLMAIVVGIDRGFISRSEGIERFEKIINFLEEADRFHGAWSHWLDGNSGSVIPFSANDNGGDLVETSFLVMGLLTVRQYLNDQDSREAALINKIDVLWKGVEWNWYQQDNQNALYWHWSPNFGWEKNLKIRGYNESLITYILAASSPTFGIAPSVYHEGWAANGNMINGNEYFGINLPLGPNLGGPLFFEHYTFLAIDPRNLSDDYANYWNQGVNHTLINRQYCIENPLQNVGYNSNCWGLTASDGNTGYSAHSPTNDRGVITPTAAISSIAYSPEESMAAMKHFYYLLGDKLWGEFGFYDAFNSNEGWVANSYLAIDQGPIIIMIENHRSGLLWDLFMSCPEVQNGLDTLGFNY